METHPKRARAGTPHKLIPYMVSFMAGGLVLAALLGGYVVHNTSVGKSALEAFSARGFSMSISRPISMAVKPS